MKLINNILYIEFAEMVEAGIKEPTMKMARLRETSGWNFVDDPDDQRRVLVEYFTLKDQYREKVDAKFQPNAFAFYRASIIESFLPAAEEPLNFYRDYRFATGTGLPHERINSYTAAARYCKLIAEMAGPGGKARLRTLGMSKADFYSAIAAIIKAKALPLPTAYTKLLNRANQVNKEGFASLVSKKFANDNSQKLTTEQRQWAVVRYAQITKPEVTVVYRELSKLSKTNNWPMVSESCVRKYLQQPEVEQVWYINRHGWKAWRNKYEHHAKLAAPSFRDALWTSDGSKLNFFFQDEKGRMTSSQSMYFVMDCFSEVILGWHISRSEDHVAQFSAFKMAVNTAQHRPVQILYDNQAGHKSAKTSEFLDRLARAHFPAMPYNPQAKPIESLIGRFQKQVMNQLWFFTGQNITSVSLDSKANQDAVEKKKDQLPTLDQVIASFQGFINEWNNEQHPHHACARAELYKTSQPLHRTPIALEDMVDLFWIYTDREITYRRGGLKIEITGQAYEFEVIDEATQQPDVDFINRYIQDKFIVAYDPDNLDHIRLYKRFPDGDRRFVTVAKSKTVYPRALADHTPGTREAINKMLDVRKRQRANVEGKLDEMRETAGVESEFDLAARLMSGDKQASIDAEDRLLAAQRGSGRLYSDDGDETEGRILE